MFNRRYIPIVESDQRKFPRQERRNEHNAQFYGGEERRSASRRQTWGVSKNELEHVTDVLREEQQTLISFIGDKEKKKQQVFRFQLTAIALLAAALITALPMIEKLIEQNKSSYSMTEGLTEHVFLALVVFNVVGLVGITLINFTTAAVTRQITSIKLSIILAARQLNCNREAIQDAIAARLCGTYPIGNWKSEAKTKANQWWLAHYIYVRHNKFPIDNRDLRKFYLRRHINTVVYVLYLLLYPFFYINIRRNVRMRNVNLSLMDQNVIRLRKIFRENGKLIYSIRITM